MLFNHIGTKVEIVGIIKQVSITRSRYGQPIVFLNMTDNYPNQACTLVVWSEEQSLFFDSLDKFYTLEGKWISVTGVLSKFGLTPQIILESPTQLIEHSGQAAAESRLGLSTKAVSPPTSTAKRPSTLEPQQVREMYSQSSVGSSSRVGAKPTSQPKKRPPLSVTTTQKLSSRHTASTRPSTVPTTVTSKTQNKPSVTPRQQSATTPTAQTSQRQSTVAPARLQRIKGKPPAQTRPGKVDYGRYAILAAIGLFVLCLLIVLAGTYLQ